MRTLSKAALLLFALLPIAAKESKADETEAPFAYNTIYSLKFPTLDGDHKRLADFRGKKTLLHVFASW